MPILSAQTSARHAAKAKAFTDERVWQMGIVLAAQELKLDLQHAEVDLPRGKIILRGANGIERAIPVDRDGYFYIDWRLTPNDPRLSRAPIENLLRAELPPAERRDQRLERRFSRQARHRRLGGAGK